MVNKHIKIGTRGSKLALFQAYQVRDALKRIVPDWKIDVVIVKTKGDKILDVALSKIGDKGLFTKELEDLILTDELDIAVHSLKDLPTVLPKGLKISGVLPRYEVRDALVTRNKQKLHELNEQNIVATSSLRRKSQLLKYNPKLKIVDIRGNVDTRIRKLQEGHCDALIMAAAGLLRLGYGDQISEIISPNDIIPAVGQGIIAIESKSVKTDINEIVGRINHNESYIIGEAERIFMHTIKGGCQVPVAIYSRCQNGHIEFTGYIGSLDGIEFVTKKISGKITDASEMAKLLAIQLMEDGGEEILSKIIS